MYKGYKEWRGQSYALNLRGEPRNLEPLLSDKNAPRQSVCIACIQIVSRGTSFSALPFAHKSNYSIKSFLGFFGLVRNKS